ncbi:hypothetical protein A1O1_03032, partial [Capronia coronata CBS 617.96]
RHHHCDRRQNRNGVSHAREHLGVYVPLLQELSSSGMKEHHEKAVHLPEDDPEAFEVVAKWMYSNSVPNEFQPSVLVHAYHLARKFCMTDLQNAVMD